MHLPCIETRRLEGVGLAPELSLSEHKVAVFTSWRAAAYALEHERVSAYLKTAKIFCFGDKAKHVLKQHGFEAESFEGIRSAQKIPSMLAQKLHPNSFILLPGPKQRAFPLHEALAESGFQSQTLDLYETVPFLKMPEEEKQALILGLRGVIFFASPSACLGFIECFSPQNNRLGHALSVLALGPTTAEACKTYFAHLRVSKENSIENAVRELVEIQNLRRLTDTQ